MIEKELKVIDNKLANIITDNSDIYCDISEFIKKSSKRIRSKLAILYLKGNNKELSEDIYNVLTVGELIHNASLLHDDVIDDNKIRRGESTISEKYSPKMSILSGDYLLSLGVNILLKIENKTILEKFTSCTQNMAKAEIIQFINRGSIPNKNEYFNICRGKTAQLFETILESCALLSGLQGNNAQELGKIFGIIFQINNDLNQHSRENDKKNGIYTAIDIFGVEKTKALIDNYKEEISKIILNYPNVQYKQGIKDLVNSL